MAVKEAFEARFPDVEIEYLWRTALGETLDHSATERILTMIAGGIAPDLVMVDGQNVPHYAVHGLLLPLDEYAARSEVQRESFVAPAWNQTHWDGRMYAMTLQVDPNFANIWNKDRFDEVGLDSDRGPATVSEWEEYFLRLTRIDADGMVTHIGALPWRVYGGANTTFTWGWIFGGRFFDYEANRVTASHPQNVRALEFLRDYFQRYGNILASDVTFPARGVGMTFAVTSDVNRWRRDFPDIPLGAGLLPYAEGAEEPNPSWIGGWAMGILRESQNHDLAWEFLRFITATPEGTKLFAQPSSFIPAYLPSPVMYDYLEDPLMSVYLQIAQTARFVRPAMPAIGYYMTELNQAFQAAVINVELMPRDALQFVERQVQRELDELLAR